MTHGFQWLDEWDARAKEQHRAEERMIWRTLGVIGCAVGVIEIALLVLMR